MRHTLSRLRCFLLLLITVPAFAGVHMPTGEYRASVTDLEVKVMGGLVSIERTWQADDLNKGQYRWHPNPAWADLEFELDVIDGEPNKLGVRSIIAAYFVVQGRWDRRTPPACPEKPQHPSTGRTTSGSSRPPSPCPARRAH